MSMIKHKGIYVIRCDKQKQIVVNTITNNALYNIAATLKGNANMEIKYLAFGTGTTIPSVSDTKLANEIGRIPIGAQAQTGSKIVSHFTISSSDYDGTVINEFGIFCGTGANSTTDSGILLSRILAPITKVSGADILIERTDILTQEE